MRRTLLLGAIVPILALGFVAGAEAVLLAQSPKTPAALSSQAPSPRGTPAPIGPQSSDSFGTATSLDSPTPLAPPAGAAAPRTSEAASPALDSLPIRQRFIELSRKKAYALTEEQLKHEVETMEAEVRELEAWAKAQEAVKQLHEVMEKHPNTKAAETANAAIQLIEQGRNARIDQRHGERGFRVREEAPKAAPFGSDANPSS